MAVAFDSTGNDSAAGTSSWTHVTVGTNLVMLVGIGYSLNATITGITYRGSNFVLLSTLSEGSAGTGRAVDIWGLISPLSPGSGTVGVSFSGTGPVGGGSVAFTGANLTSPYGTPATNGGTAVAATSVTTNSTINDVVFSAVAARTTTTVTNGGSQTPEWNTKNSSNIASAGTIQTGGVGVTSSFAWTGADNGAMAAIPILAPVLSSSKSGANYGSPHIIVGDGMSRSEVAN